MFCIRALVSDEAYAVVGWADNGVGAVASPRLGGSVGRAGTAQLRRSMC